MSDQNRWEKPNSEQGTQPLSPLDNRPSIPPPSRNPIPTADPSNRPPPPRNMASMNPSAPENRRSAAANTKRKKQSRSGFYLPAWSVLLMIVTVFLVAFGIVALVISLGGTLAPDDGPRIIIITAVPTDSNSQVIEGEPTATTALLPAQNVEDGALPVFALEGPTLPPVILSPTPIVIMINSQVTVTNDDVRLRPSPGTAEREIRLLSEGEPFLVIGGPQQANGITWWQVRSSIDATLTGWIAGNYLIVQE